MPCGGLGVIFFVFLISWGFLYFPIGKAGYLLLEARHTSLLRVEVV